MLRIVVDIFGKNFLKNALIGFTRWPYDKKEEMKRQSIGASKEKSKQEINSKLKEIFEIDYEVDCVFFDNTYNNKGLREAFDDYELKLFEEEFERIWSFL